MVRFEVIAEEGMHFVRATLEDDAIRAEAGALARLHGDLSVEASIPSPVAWVRAVLGGESAVRPRYVGTGVVDLEASLAGFHAFDLREEAWILDRGAYWASSDGISLTLYRESVLNAFWSGEGLVEYRTRVGGTGQVVLATKGPVHEVALRGERYWSQGAYVIARTEGITKSIERPTRSFWRSFLTGERLIQGFQGTGRLLVCQAPHWRLLLSGRRQATVGPPVAPSPSA